MAISVVPELPGSWELWTALSPNEYRKSDISDHVHATWAVDEKLLHRLHGGQSSRGWDPRPAKLWITHLKPYRAMAWPSTGTWHLTDPDAMYTLQLEGDLLCISLKDFKGAGAAKASQAQTAALTEAVQSCFPPGEHDSLRATKYPLGGL